MPDILHRVGIKTTPEKVFEALSTIEGLSHWWIRDTAGNAKQGGIILFGFSDMKVVELKPHKLVKPGSSQRPLTSNSRYRRSISGGAKASSVAMR